MKASYVISSIALVVSLIAMDWRHSGVLERQRGLIARVDSLELEASKAAPIGSIIPWVGRDGDIRVIPHGWAICNGQPIKDDWDVSMLRAIGLSERIPDLTGRFLGGVRRKEEPGTDASTGIFSDIDDLEIGQLESEDWHTLVLWGEDRKSHKVISSSPGEVVPRELGQSPEKYIYTGRGDDNTKRAGLKIEWEAREGAEIRPATARVLWLMRVY